MSFNKMVTAHRVWKEGTHTEKSYHGVGEVGSVVFKCAPSITILYLYLYFLSITVSTNGQNLDQYGSVKDNGQGTDVSRKERA